ncbi:MAG: transposase [archaeon]
MKTNWKNLTRYKRGELISKDLKIEKIEDKWKVPSQSGDGFYYVYFDGHKPQCNCLDCRIRHGRCKHIIAVELFIQRRINSDGTISETKKVKIGYAQNWKAYDKSQTNEKLFFLRLLKELCRNVEQPEYKFGRPTLPISDMIFASILKVYTTFSLRRFMSDMKIVKEMGLVDYVCTYPTISNFIKKKELTKILKELIKISSAPLSSVESSFSADSSGFATCRFARYFDYKWGKKSKYRLWLKAHILCGNKTNIITCAEITDGTSNDSPQLTKLVDETAKRFKMGGVCCDKAYSSRKNLELIHNVGAVPYIPFKKNVTGKSGGSAVWRKMYYYFMYKNEDFKKYYHKRSNVETVFHMIKTKFKDNLRSKNKQAQINELLCKILCHNLCVLIQEVNELGIRSEFVSQQSI